MANVELNGVKVIRVSGQEVAVPEQFSVTQTLEALSYNIENYEATREGDTLILSVQQGLKGLSQVTTVLLTVNLYQKVTKINSQQTLILR